MDVGAGHARDCASGNLDVAGMARSHMARSYGVVRLG